MNSAPNSRHRVLVVAESDSAARDVQAMLGLSPPAALHVCMAGDAAGQAAADVVVLAFATLDAACRHAAVLRPAASAGLTSPLLVVRCRASDVRDAAERVRQGIVDDYVVAGSDPHRLAVTVHLVGRLAAFARPARTRPLVLVVEDDAFAQELVAATLGFDAIELHFESDGSHALDRIRELQPDLVLMDVGLPGLDGVELTQRLKADAVLASTPVVMLTGEARRETLKRSLEAGAADFVVKPFTPDGLRGKIAKYLPTP